MIENACARYGALEAALDADEELQLLSGMPCIISPVLENTRANHPYCTRRTLCCCLTSAP